MKKRYVLITTLAFLLLMVTSAMSFAGGAFAGDRAPRMTVSQLAGMLDSPDVVVIDVRRDKDFKGSEKMIKGAQRRAFNDVDGWAGELAKDKTLVLYCAWPSEYTSARVAQALLKKGFTKVYALKGGWEGWLDGGYPTENK